MTDNNERKRWAVFIDRGLNEAKLSIKDDIIHIKSYGSRAKVVIDPSTDSITTTLSGLEVTLSYTNDQYVISFESKGNAKAFISVLDEIHKHKKPRTPNRGPITKMFGNFREKVSKSGSNPSPSREYESKDPNIIDDLASNVTITQAKLCLFHDKSYSIYYDIEDRKEQLVSAKGEIGCLPVFSDSYKDRLHISYQSKWPTNVTATVISENWTNNGPLMWKEIQSKFASKICEKALFDFSWRGLSSWKIDNNEEVTWERSIQSCNIPLHYSSVEGIWTLLEGEYTHGTCYRKSNSLLDAESKWLTNAICNFYQVKLLLCSERHAEKPSKSLINMYRHGIVGYKQIPLTLARHLVPQVYLALQKAITTQKEMMLPPRIVSHNLVNQTKILGTLNKERHMLERHETAFSIALTMVIQQGTNFGEFPISLGHFYLPTNTDKNLLSLGDSEVGINNLGSLLYLRWVCEDCCDVFSRLFLSKDHARTSYCRFEYIDAYKDARWKNNEFLDLFDISFAHIVDELMAQYPQESGMLLFLLSPDRVETWEIFCNTLLFEIDKRERAMLQCEVIQLQSFLRVMGIILSSVGLTVYKQLLKVNTLDSQTMTKVLEDVQRCRIAVNLLRVLFHSEVFSSKKKGDIDFGNKEKLLGKRRFTRVTSLLCAGLLDYCLGACVFVNCKSGLDRTGLFVGVHNSLATLWELYPHIRWELHLVCINYNSLRNSALGGTFKISDQTQPPSILLDNIAMDEYLMQYQQLVDVLSGKQPTTVSQKDREETFGKPVRHCYFVATKVLYDDGELLQFGLPLFFLIRNYNLAFLIDINSLITYASTGLRGMKYRNHLVAGPLLPSFATTNSGDLINIIKRSPTISGGGIADFLTERGLDLLVDLAMHRKS